jgi:hypothetical protein
MRPDVALAFDRMAAAAREEAGLFISVTSGFRSDAEQARLFAAHPSFDLLRERAVVSSLQRNPGCRGFCATASIAGLSDAPREIRTPTVQTNHEALNLAGRTPMVSMRRRYDPPSR